MKANDDPRILFDQLASIQSAYNDATRKIDPDDLSAMVLEKAPDGYKSLLTVEQRNKGNNLTLDDLRSCMNDLFRTLQSNKVAKSTDNDLEVSLVASNSKFNGIYGYFQKTGHMTRDCRKKESRAEHESKQCTEISPTMQTLREASMWIADVRSCRRTQVDDQDPGFQHPYLTRARGSLLRFYYSLSQTRDSVGEHPRHTHE
jgi:hypothetical protein